MRRFNNGEPYHGSAAVSDGRLTGRTVGTDYFYFMCPECPEPHILRVLDYGIHAESAENPYNDGVEQKAIGAFTIAFKLYCERCGLTDVTKLSNTGWQGGNPNTV